MPKPKTRTTDMSEQADLPEAAKRALVEAEERRKKQKLDLAKELGGRDGPEPVRFGDWERNGIAVDF
ncbi:dihydrodipicolinate reductase [Falsihalocynthiibacter arcticus]|uniref:Dihydrodipicolinate reductase n=2 Tax=Falsihalocynthiibacter arcticus TaxID=1579316 RepID=A0A126UY05_9RHOB|nr:dihydrodipicolinate reductase [Falsihalocynthiibacter arcticus]